MANWLVPTAMLEKVTVTPLLLVKVTDWEVVAALVYVLEKARDKGDTTTAFTPAPKMLAVVGEVASLLATMMVAVSGVATDGVKVARRVHDDPAAIVVPFGQPVSLERSAALAPPKVTALEPARTRLALPLLLIVIESEPLDPS